jgi:predicted Abi (CAAX) family protease
MTKEQLFSRLLRAVRTPPSRRHWGFFAAEASWLLPLLVALGWAADLIHWNPRFDAGLLKLALLALVIPALGEELLFRAALLPSPDNRIPLPPWRLAMSVGAFVIWHPLQAPIFGDHWQQVVLNPWFLAAVFFFGVASARLYWRTGSIWPSVALHWLVVVGWKALLGGPSPWVSN